MSDHFLDLSEVDPPPNYGDFTSALQAIEQLVAALDTIPADRVDRARVGRTFGHIYGRILAQLRTHVELYRDIAIRHEATRLRRWVLSDGERSPNTDGE